MSLAFSPTLLKYDDAPHFLKTNPYIRSGYRAYLPSQNCVRSLFCWSNETLNIWTHVLGCIFFSVLFIYDFFVIAPSVITVSVVEKALLLLLLVCFQSCTLLSACYHLFNCGSEEAHRMWLSLDLFGIALSLLGIYVTGIYYAFACEMFWLDFYLLTVGGFFFLALSSQVVLAFNINRERSFRIRMSVFSAWAGYGFVPIIHWVVHYGGLAHPLVQMFLPRVFGMYAIGGTAFFIYLTKVPEKLFPGKVDFIGSSHQFWHVLVVLAFYYWHNTGLQYISFRTKYPCHEEH